VSAAERDPFALTADISGYVARPATDAAFAALERVVFDEGGVALLTGPPGLGKTLLLRRLAAAAHEETTPIFLPYAALAPDEFCGWTLAALDAEPTDDPIGLFRTFVRHLQASDNAILLVVDDASVLPSATARWLAHLASGSGGAVRLALAAVDGGASGRLVAALGEAAVEVRLDQPMTQAETRAYLAARLGSETRTADGRSLFDDDTIEFLQRASGGIPRDLHAAAAALLRSERTEEDREFQDEVAAARERASDLGGVFGRDEALAELTGEGAEPEEETIEPVSFEPVSESTPRGPEEGDSIVDPEALPDWAVSDPDDEFSDPDSDARVGVSPPEPSVYLSRPAPRRVEPAPALRWVLLVAIAVAGAAVMIPLMRAQVGPDASTPPPRSVSSRIEAPVVGGDASPPVRERERAMAIDEKRVRAPTVVGASVPPRAGGAEPARPEPSRDGSTEEPAFVRAPEFDPLPGPEPELAVESRPRPRLESVPRPDADPTSPSAIAGPGLFDVSINATPWANIEIDGVDVGVTPIGTVPLLAGPHTFTAHMPDGRIVERVVEISAEERFIAFE
jgi:type II secretory pathway predicted ATPase ExeA